MPERVQREPLAGRGDSGARDRGAEVFADVAVVEAAALSVRQDEVMGALIDEASQRSH